MEWFEYLIIVGALIIVAIPIYQAISDYKKGKVRCGNDCGSCAHQKSCENLQSFFKDKIKK